MKSIKKNIKIRQIMILLLCITMLAQYFLQTGSIVQAAAKTATITATNVNVRKGASTEHKILQYKKKNVMLTKGDKVTIVKQKKDWYQVSFKVGKKTLKGYIRKDFLKINKTTSSNTATNTSANTTSTAVIMKNSDLKTAATVNATNINVRKSASRTAAQLKINKTKVALPSKAKVTILGEQIVKNEKWYYISFKFDGKTAKGYVLSDYVKLTLSSAVKGYVNTNKDIKVRTAAGNKKGYLKAGSKTISVKHKQSVAITREMIADGQKWFRISFTHDGAEKSGYILANSILLKGKNAIEEPNTTTNSNDSKPSEASDETKKTGKTTDTLRVRTGAGTNKEQMTTSAGTKISLTKGQTVTILGEQKDGSTTWYKVSFQFEGKSYTGYVSGDYITLNQTESKEEPEKNEPKEEPEKEPEKDPVTNSDNNTAGNAQVLSDEEFEQHLKAEGFPESYKASLRELHKKYPYWRFEAYQTGLDWNTVIEKEGKIGYNLISNAKHIGWKSMEPGAYNWKTDRFISYDGSSWVTASKQALEYYMDPRNFLNVNGIFQFESLKYQSSYQDVEGVEKILKNTPLYKTSYSYKNSETEEEKTYTYGETFIKAAEYSGVSPYHLAARVKQEVVAGSTTLSNSVSGTVAGYEGFYNFYNIGATHSIVPGGNIINALNYAKNGSGNQATNELYMIPWNSQYNSIVGGSQFIGSTYISKGQDTIYLQKFNVTPVSTYGHQYMANVEAPLSEAIKTMTAYSDLEELPIVFSIPIYSNMPASACKEPEEIKNPNNWLSSLTVENMTLDPVFQADDQEGTIYNLLIEEEADAIIINAKAVSKLATVEGAGTIPISGSDTITIKVTAEDGTIRRYTIMATKVTQ